MPAAVHAGAPRRAPPTTWPIRRSYLAALKDLGLSDGQVAGYFGVEQDEVGKLRACYGIAECSGPVTGPVTGPVRAEHRKRRLFAWRRKA